MAVVQWLSEFFVLAKDLTSVSSTHVQWLSPGTNPLSRLQRYLNSHRQDRQIEIYF